MISLKCPHCYVALKVDEQKIPVHLSSFKCPKCKQLIPIALVDAVRQSNTQASETVLIQPLRTQVGTLEVVQNEYTPAQTLSLYEGVQIIGRKSNHPSVVAGIETEDRSMSREHIRIEVVKDAKGGYKHYLSDNNSKNKTLYNSNYLVKEEIVILQDNDEIVIGHTLLRFKA